MTRTGALQRAAAAVLGAGLAFPAVVAVAPLEAQARKAGVNRPVRRKEREKKMKYFEVCKQ